MMKRWTTLMVLVLVLGLGSYAIFAQPPSVVPGRGTGRGMGGGMMGRGMMQNCPMMQQMRQQGQN